jgi:hypothetical protein
MELRFSAAKKNKDNMLLLLTYRPVLKEIVMLRKRLGIKRSSIGILEDIEDIEKRLTYEQQCDIVKTIKRVMDTYNVPENYARYIRSYILEGEVNAPLNNFAVQPFFPSLGEEAHENHLKIEVYAKLTKQEWEDLKREVGKLGRNLPGAFKPLKTLRLKLKHEDEARSVQKYNKSPDREYYLTYGEAQRSTEPQTMRENIRELKDLRKKRFGREKQDPFLP